MKGRRKNERSSSELASVGRVKSLAMTNRTVNLRIDVLLFLQLLAVRTPLLLRKLLAILARGLPIKFGYELNGSKVRFRIAMAVDAPSHRQFLCLVNHFHLVDAAVASLTAHSRIDVRRMIEIDELGEVVNPLPTDTAACFPALVNRSKLRTRRPYGRQRRDPLIVGWAMAVDTGRGRGHRCMRRLKHSVVAVSAIQLQLACVQRMTERDRLSGLVADIQCLGVRDQAPHGASENGPSRDRDSQQAEKWIGPAWKQKPLHDDFGRRLGQWPILAQKRMKNVATLLTCGTVW